MRGFALAGFTLKDALHAGLRLAGVDGFSVRGGALSRERRRRRRVALLGARAGRAELRRGPPRRRASTSRNSDHVVVEDNAVTESGVGALVENSSFAVVRHNQIFGNARRRGRARAPELAAAAVRPRAHRRERDRAERPAQSVAARRRGRGPGADRRGDPERGRRPRVDRAQPDPRQRLVRRRDRRAIPSRWSTRASTRSSTTSGWPKNVILLNGQAPGPRARRAAGRRHRVRPEPGRLPQRTPCCASIRSPRTTASATTAASPSSRRA